VIPTAYANAALRRDFGALAQAIGRADGPAPRDRALARYGRTALWRLEHHHHGEDARVWPLLRANAPEAAALLDALEAEHQHLDRLVADARAALEATGSRHDQPQAAGRDPAAVAWAALSTALGSHLDREEQQVLPLLGQRVTAAEWKPVDRYFIRTLGPRQLLAYIPWLSSAADAHERTQLLRTQPAAFRVIEALTRPWFARRQLRLGLPQPLPASAARPLTACTLPGRGPRDRGTGNQASSALPEPQGPGSHPYTPAINGGHDDVP
jgi:hypothetical protein